MPNTENKKIYNLEDRTGKFGEEVIKFVKSLPKNVITLPIISQLVRSSTSIGANYCEADCAESRKDFEHKLGICKKEAKETSHWLRMIMVAVPEAQKEARILWQEAKELQLILITIVRNSRENSLEISNQ